MRSAATYPLPSTQPNGPQGHSAWRVVLGAACARFAPDLLDGVPALLQQYGGNEALVLSILAESRSFNPNCPSFKKYVDTLESFTRPENTNPRTSTYSVRTFDNKKVRYHARAEDTAGNKKDEEREE